MTLMVMDEKTQLPVPTAEALTIEVLNKLWRRVRKIDGDSDGRKKILNIKEFGYVYFQGKFDSRFKLKDGEERVKAIKKLLGLPEEWVPDELVNEAIPIFADTQITASSEYVSSLEGTVSALSSYLKNAKDQIKAGNIKSMPPKDVKDLMAVINDSPNLLKTVSECKAVLQKEQHALATGRKDRRLNKFEMPGS